MDTLPYIIEFCGIPYSRKTTVLSHVESILRNNKKSFTTIEEFNGDRRFYESAKYYSDLNISRSLKCLDSIITSVHSVRNEFILVDRGIFDSLCWLYWFEKRGKATKEQVDSVERLLSLVKIYSSNYRAFWMDIDPYISNANHAGQGSIINSHNLMELRSMYETVITKLYEEKYDITKIDVLNFNNSYVLAEKIMGKYKVFDKGIK